MQLFDFGIKGKFVLKLTANQHATMWGWRVEHVNRKPLAICPPIHYSRLDAESEINHFVDCLENANITKGKTDDNKNT